MPKQPVCVTTDIPANGMKECAAAGGMKVLILNAGDEYFACQAQCPHQEVALCEGMFDGSTLTCHQHLWQWDIRSGAPLGAAEAPLVRYDVSVENGAVCVEVPGA